MDDLRYKIYHPSKFSNLLSLPLTSADLYLHFLRYMYTTYIQTHCLQNVTVDPTKYDYEDNNGSLVPTHHINNVSESLVQKCSCKCANINTVHAEVLMSLANVKNNISRQFCMNRHVVIAVPVPL